MGGTPVRGTDAAAAPVGARSGSSTPFLARPVPPYPIPSFYVVYTLCGIFSAAVYFDELSSMSSDQQTMFGVGVGLTFLGVLCLTGRLRSVPAPPPASPKPDSATLSDPDPVAVPAIDSDLEKSASFEVVHHRVVAVADKTVGARGGTMGGLVFRDD
ncbi:hypothetical protein AMAG_19110 [Allomyces macrogynus ATCC 38327]|uniref:Uncharacterized protein n=1 Tax=Allomyces macrogynus (strain ATCC 38327) TaxID=578462 RepID=A0A0L0SP40_ALLM3|nr:hypothetical protein AMAG_19110 [Allomyces macrogynus ATCC 38327]|eukprot:KNE64135.1 hypothetical protein AMAG_19110 [Allomyces macrogynus ATCC 38327]